MTRDNKIPVVTGEHHSIRSFKRVLIDCHYLERLKSEKIDYAFEQHFFDEDSDFKRVDGYVNIFNVDTINDAFRAAEILMQQDHCGCFQMTTLCEIYVAQTDGIDTLVLGFDTESG